MATNGGRILIGGHPYNIASVPDAYKVTEIPNHGDVDPKMERRVIWRNFSLGINRRREDPSLDATSVTSRAFTYMRQVRNPEGIYWPLGCDTTRQDRVFAQRATFNSNFNDPNEVISRFIDGSLASVAVSKNKIYQLLTPPATWGLSAQLSSANEISDAIQYGGQIYVAIAPTSGTTTAVSATTVTDSTANWVVNQFVGATVTVGTSTAKILFNTSTVATLTPAGWTGVTPALGTYQFVKGLWTWNQLSTGSWIQQPNTVTASKFTVIREQLWRAINANIYSTINTDPTNQIWSGATIIGDPSTNITGLDSFKDFLMIFKPDGVYSADKTGSVYPLFPGFKNLGTNPRPLGQFQDRYFFASDAGLVWSYSPRGGVQRIGFDYAEPYPMDPSSTAPFSVPNAAVSQCTSLTHYTIVGFNQFVASPTSSAFFFGWDGTGWHPIQYFPSATVQACGMTGGNINPANPLLHFAITVNGATQIKYMQNPLLDPYIARSFDTSTQAIYLPVDNGALEDEYKILERINVIVDNPEAGTVKMFYSVDEEIANLTFHDMGDPVFNRTKGNQVFLPPSPLPTYIRIMLKFTITATTPPDNTPAKVSPAIRTIILHYKQRYPQRREWDIVLLADDNVIGANGRLDVRNSKKMINDLNQARINHLQIPLVDALEVSQDVYVDEVMESIQILKGNQNPSYLVTVKLVESVVGK